MGACEEREPKANTYSSLGSTLRELDNTPELRGWHFVIAPDGQIRLVPPVRSK
jgi:hypothetical protein